MTILTILNSILARALDALAVLAARVLPIADAGVFFTSGRSWQVDAWKEGKSLFLEVGSWTLEVDLK
jgi:Na+/H+ antiporter NhaC